MTQRDDRDEAVWATNQLREWVGMPQFESRWARPWVTVQVGFACRADMDAFAELIGAQLTEKTRSVWYPPLENVEVKGHMRYAVPGEEPSQAAPGDTAAPGARTELEIVQEENDTQMLREEWPAWASEGEEQ